MNWKEVHADVVSRRSVYLKIGDHVLTIEHQLDSKRMKTVFMVYVDHYFKGCNKESEIGKMFYRPQYIWTCTPKQEARNLRIWRSKMKLKAIGMDRRKIHYGYTPYFNSFRELVKVLSKHKDIEQIQSSK